MKMRQTVIHVNVFYNELQNSALSLERGASMNKDMPHRQAHVAGQVVSLQGRKQIADLCDLATQAVVRPSRMTQEEIQEIGWGLLMLARKLHSQTLARLGTPAGGPEERS